MKKLISIIGLTILLAGGSYFLFTTKIQQKSVQKNSPETINQKTEKTTEKIKEMVAKNLSLKCIYEIPEGGKVTSYLKGKDKIRTKVETKEGENEAIFLINKLYSWDNKTRQGITISIANIDEIKRKQDDQTIIENPEKYIEELEKSNPFCQEENFPDGFFQPPPDIKFQNLDKIQEVIKGGKLQLPEVIEEKTQLKEKAPSENEEE